MDFDLKEVEFDPEVRFVESTYKAIFGKIDSNINLPFEDKRKALYYCLDNFCTQDEKDLLILRNYYGISLPIIAALYHVSSENTISIRSTKTYKKLRNGEASVILRNGYVQALYFIADEYQKAYKEELVQAKKYEKSYKETMAQIKEYEKAKEAC